MIISVKGKRASDVVNGRWEKGFQPDLVKRIRAVFSALEAATDLQDLQFPPGNRLKKLKGGRAGQYSLRVNVQWRVCFIWTDDGPAEVEIIDYH